MHLFFDLDGTLTDPQLGITTCIQYALRRLGRPAPPRAALTRYIGPPLRDSFLELLGSQRDAERAVAHYRERFARAGMYENRLYDDIVETLSTLDETHARAMYVVTSKPTVYARDIVAHFGLCRFFRRVYGSRLDGSLTDKRELIGLVLREERIAARSTVMIGDRQHDIAGALSNGLHAIGVLWGYGSRRELTESGAHHLCARPRQLQECVELCR